MEQIGEYRGVNIYWSDPEEDGGNGTGEVMTNDGHVGYANTEEEARALAEQEIDDYLGKLDNMEEVE